MSGREAIHKVLTDSMIAGAALKISQTQQDETSMTNHPTDQSEARAREVLAVVLGHHPSVTDNGYEPPVDFGQAVAAMLSFAARPAGEVEQLREVAADLNYYTSHSIGCALYQQSWVGGTPRCSCGLDDARAALQEPTR